MGEEDRSFKELLEAFFGDLLSLMVPDLAAHLQAEGAEFIRDEFFADAPETKRRQVDLLAKVPTDRGEEELVLVHVEVEGQAGSGMGRRMWQYAMLIRSRHELPLIPLVVYLRGGKPGAHEEIHSEVVLGHEMVRFHYFSFGLSGSSAEEHLARPEPLAWALSSLMRDKELTKARHRLEAMRRILRADLDVRREYLLGRCVRYYLKLDADERKEYEDMLAERNHEDVEEFEGIFLTDEDKEAIRAARKEARREGLAEGRREGRRQGRREGRRDAMRTLLFLQLEGRFGTVPETMRHRIEQLDSTEELTRWAQRVVTVGSLEELVAD